MSESKPISYSPTEGLTYSPNDQHYWDELLLQKEINRIFEICHGCRMCFKFCDSFPTLFNLVDQEHDGDVTKVTPKQTKKIMDQCFQCKLCEVQCPYTPRDQHEYQVDFPKLVHRYKAIQGKKFGHRLRDKILAAVDFAARIARSSFGLTNYFNRVKFHRFFMEKFLGIHRNKLLPQFANKTFESWATKNNKLVNHDQNLKNETILFQTCYVQNNEPQIGKDTIFVLEKNTVQVGCVKGLQCCGMPAWEHGDLKTLQKMAKINLDILHPFAQQGSKILAINPTCSMMLRREYPELVAPEDQQRAKELSLQVMDPSEYLWSIRKEERFNTDFKSSPGEKVAYHTPCHLRAQSIGFKGRDLIKKIPGVTIPNTVMECCGHDGTYAMKVESYESSIKIGQKSFKGMKDIDSEIWVTDCPLAAIQFEQHAGVKPMHPMSLLANAYTKDGLKDTDEDKNE